MHTYFNIIEPLSPYSYSTFEVLIIFVLNNTYDVVDFDSPSPQNIHEAQIKYESRRCTKILTRRLLKFLSFVVNATITKTVDFVV